MDYTGESFYSGESFSLQRNRILPSAEDFYLCLTVTEKELDFIARSRLKQADEDEGYCASRSSSTSSLISCSPSASYTSREDLVPSSDNFYESLSDDEWDFKESVEQEHPNSSHSVSIRSEKKVILPEPELSSTHFIPPHIEAFDEIYETTLGKSGLQAEQPRNRKGPFGSYCAAMNTASVVSMRAFGPNRTDSLFKFIFGKFREQHRIK